MIRTALIFAANLLATPVFAADQPEFDPATFNVVDAITCRLEATVYNGFAMSLEGDEGIAANRHWKKIASGNPFMDEYGLPEPITIKPGYATNRIGLSSGGIAAILDLPDPAVIAREEKIENEMKPDALIEAIVASGKATRAEVEAEIKFHKVMGQRLVSDVTVPATKGDSFETHTVISHSIANATTHPGKTLHGSSYTIELLGRDGKPLA